MIDDKTKNLKLPLPHRQNNLDVDVGRIRTSLELVDANAEKLQTAINDEEKSRKIEDKKLSDEFTKSIESESTARTQADQSLADGIEALQTGIRDEISARQNVDQDLADSISAIAGNLDTLDHEVTAADRLGNKKAGTGLIINGDTLNVNKTSVIGQSETLLVTQKGLTDAINRAVAGISGDIHSSGTGWIRFTDGTQMCWGVIANGTYLNPNRISYKVTLPVGFLGTAYSISCLWENEFIMTSLVPGIWLNKQTANGFMAYAHAASAYTTTSFLNYTVIGRWK